MTEKRLLRASLRMSVGGCRPTSLEKDGIARMVADPQVDTVVSAIVGSAGLLGTWAALEAGSFRVNWKPSE